MLGRMQQAQQNQQAGLVPLVPRMPRAGVRQTGPVIVVRAPRKK